MRNFLLRLLPWLVVLLGLTATWIAWQQAAERAEAERAAHFESRFRQAAAAIVSRLDSYRDANLGGAGLFRASEEVTRQEWHQYAESLDLSKRHPGARGIGVVEPRIESGVERYIVRYFEPEAGNQRELGRDLATDEDLRLAMEQARDGGEAVLSGRVLLTVAGDSRPGFILFTPVYSDDASGGTPTSSKQRREQIVGWIYTPFVASEFVDGLFADVLHELRGELTLGLYDGGSPAPGQLLHQDVQPPEPRGSESSATLLASATMPVHGRTWSILARPGTRWKQDGYGREGVLIAVSGVLISLGLFGLLHGMQRTRRRALALAEEMTAELRQQARDLQRSNVEISHARVRAEKAAVTLLEQHVSLTRAEKLAAVGETAGTLAHELRNPLAGILMSLENLRREPAAEPIAERLQDLIDEIGRLTRLLGEKLAPLRHAPESVTEVDVAELLTDLCNLLRPGLSKSVELVTTTEPGIRLLLPRDRLRQALLNLIFNAAQALQSEARAGRIEIGAHRRDDDLVVWVRDDGPGFPDAFLEREPMPFETSRPGGTGLGLAMVRRVARDLGGRLELCNVEPHGAQAEMILPARRA
jgi:C4-dicarboxylate-specific signal transduction histidine kinase